MLRTVTALVGLLCVGVIVLLFGALPSLHHKPAASSGGSQAQQVGTVNGGGTSGVEQGGSAPSGSKAKSSGTSNAAGTKSNTSSGTTSSKSQQGSSSKSGSGGSSGSGGTGSNSGGSGGSSSGGGSGCTSPNWPVSDGETIDTFWDCGSPYRTPIGSNPAIDPNSASVVSAMVSDNGINYAGADDEAYSTSMYYSSAADPSYSLSFSEDGNWGPNPFSQTVSATKGSGQCNPLHIPTGVVLPSGTDKWLYVVDNTKPGLVCAIWQANYSGGVWSGSYAGVTDLFGDGTAPLAGLGTGSNLMGGDILISEIASGVIPHALQFAVPCNASGVWRAPATKSDGNCSGPLEEGMRFQLDPSKVNCNNMSFAVEKMVCVALETYGAYDGDNGGNIDFGFQNAAQDSSGAYSRGGLTSDYQSFSDIPLSDFRLLAN